MKRVGRRAVGYTAIVAFSLLVQTPLSDAIGPRRLLAQSTGSGEASIERIDVGLSDQFKVGCWTAVRIVVKAGDRPLDAELQIVVPDGDGLATRFMDDRPEGGTTLKLAVGETKTIERHIKIGRLQGQLVARLVANGSEVASSRMWLGQAARPLYSTQEWIVVIGTGLPLDKAFNRRRMQGAHPPVVTEIDDVRQLPTSDLGYDGVDSVVVTTSDLPRIEMIADSQRQALVDWVHLGGRIIMTLGENGPAIAGDRGLLRSLAPIRVSGIAPPASAPGLESFAHAEQALKPFAWSVVEPGEARVIAHLDRRTEGRAPGILRYPLGLGQGTVLTFDVDREPFSSWDATARLLSEILHPDEGEASATTRESTSRRVTHIGYDDLAGQMRAALDYFPGSETMPAVAVVSFATVMLIVGVYAVLVGPGDYLLLHRVIRRMEWTWVTFPLSVVLASVVIYALGHQWRGGTAQRLKQVTLVDIDLDSGYLRGTIWAHLYSPSTRGFDLELQPHWPLADEPRQGAPRTQLTWQGLPGSGLGGFDSSAAESLAPEPYGVVVSESGDARLVQVPVATGGTKSLWGEWTDRQPVTAPSVLALDRNGFLTGELRNPLNAQLDEAFVVHGQFVYRLDRSWPGGERVRMGDLERRDLQWRLTRRRILDTKTSYATTPWDPQSREIPRIMEIMMLHKAAGGEQYTGLSQRYQAHVDLSEHLDLGRAMIIGRSAQSGAELVDRSRESPVDDIERWTWYRVIVRVDQTETAPVEGTLR